MPDVKTGKSHPPTAQYGVREGLIAAKNIEAAILGRPMRPFTFTTLGQLATIGHQIGVAIMFGVKFSGFLAWLLWRYRDRVRPDDLRQRSAGRAA